MSKASTIIGYATTFHDPAIALIAGDYIFAESIERHAQCKRAINLDGFEYSWRAVRAALRAGNASLSKDVVVRTTWDNPKADEGIPPFIPPGIFRDMFSAIGAKDRSKVLNVPFTI